CHDYPGQCIIALLGKIGGKVASKILTDPTNALYLVPGLGEEKAIEEAVETARTADEAVKSVEEAITATKDAGQVATDVGEQTVRHYTTEAAARQIARSGEIRPGASGKAFFTTGRYESAAEAQAQLALPTTPEGYFELP